MSRGIVASRLAIALTGAGLLAACGNPPAEEGAEAEIVAAVPAVEILAPVEGDSVDLPLTVRLAATGITIAPASGVREDGIGHHHILVDVEATPEGEPVPATPGYIHMGSGVSEYVLDSLPPGEHRIIAIVAWGDHVPVMGARRDTVRVVVRGR